MDSKSRTKTSHVAATSTLDSYTVETSKNWESRRKEHHNKVRLTKEDLKAGNIESANTQINTNDGGLAKHTSTCTEEINWENAKIMRREQRWTQRKCLEGIESLREKSKGIWTFTWAEIFTQILIETYWVYWCSTLMQYAYFYSMKRCYISFFCF